MKNFKEEWRDVEGYRGIYRVSDRGRVRRLPNRGRPKKRGPGAISRAKILNMTDSGGRHTVSLCRNGQRNTGSVARLVATAFIPNPQGFKFVRHKDGNAKNNWLYNLEWAKIANVIIKPESNTEDKPKKKKLTEEERSRLPGFRLPLPFYSSER